jgi:hypothetical protein
MQALETHIALQQAVQQTLAYFDLFNYPLKSSEVLNFLQVKASAAAVEETLELLTCQKQISKSGNLYALQSNPTIFQRRRNGNALADSLLPQIKRQADFIAQFPFVRSVMASGSFSKNFMDNNSDFDFFIVCAPGRIWISRMLLVLYKRIFLRNSHKHFCVNYFVDETNLEIGEKNIFTATELATVLPLNGFNQYTSLIAAHQTWLSKAFPNLTQRTVPTEKGKVVFIKTILESAFIVFGASLLNKFFKWVTVRNWKRQYSQHYSPTDFKIAFKSTDSVSKNHPRNFQKKILELYQERMRALSKKIEVV